MEDCTDIGTMEKRKNLFSSCTTTIMLLLCLSLSLLCVPSVQAQNPKESLIESVQKYTVQRHHAAQFGALPMQSSDGRIVPVNTYSSEVLRRLHNKRSLGRLNPDQFLLSVLSMPELWMDVPFIEVGNDKISETFGLSKRQCAFSEAFDETGQYKLQQKVKVAKAKSPVLRSRFDKDLIKLDERLHLYNEITHHAPLRLFPMPGDSAHRWFAAGDTLMNAADRNVIFARRFMDWYLTDVHLALRSGKWDDPNEDLKQVKEYQATNIGSLVINIKKLRAELMYNKLDLFDFCKTGYLLIGGLLLIVSFVGYKRNEDWLSKVSSILSLCIFILFVLQICGLGLRLYISDYIPLSNTYETMVFAAFVSVLGGFLFLRRSHIAFSLATMLGGIILFVSSLGWMDPQIGTFDPEVQSPKLLMQVAVVTAACGFLGIGALVGLVNLVQMLCVKRSDPALVPDSVKELTIVNRRSLWIGLILMIVGTCIGIIMANESTTYEWSWDTKETWEIVTILVYAVVLHLRKANHGDVTWLFNFSSVVCILTVLMTFFEVDKYLEGMQSDSMGQTLSGNFGYIGMALAVVLLLGFVSRKRYNRIQTNNNSNISDYATDQ